MASYLETEKRKFLNQVIEDNFKCYANVMKFTNLPDSDQMSERLFDHMSKAFFSPELQGAKQQFEAKLGSLFRGKTKEMSLPEMEKQLFELADKLGVYAREKMKPLLSYENLYPNMDEKDGKYIQTQKFLVFHLGVQSQDILEGIKKLEGAGLKKEIKEELSQDMHPGIVVVGGEYYVENMELVDTKMKQQMKDMFKNGRGVN